MSKPHQPQFEGAALTLYSQKSFYTPDDLVAAAKNWPRGEVENAFNAYRAAIESGDHATMAAMLSEDGRGGNAPYGFFHDRDAYREFFGLEKLPAL